MPTQVPSHGVEGPAFTLLVKALASALIASLAYYGWLSKDHSVESGVVMDGTALHGRGGSLYRGDLLLDAVQSNPRHRNRH